MVRAFVLALAFICGFAAAGLAQAESFTCSTSFGSCACDGSVGGKDSDDCKAMAKNCRDGRDGISCPPYSDMCVCTLARTSIGTTPPRITIPRPEIVAPQGTSNPGMSTGQ